MPEQDEQMWDDDETIDEVEMEEDADEPTADTFGESVRSSADVSDDVAQSQPQAPEEVEVEELDSEEDL